MKRRILATGTALIATFALAACSTGEGVNLDDESATSADADSEGGEDASAARVLNAAIGGEPDQLDPQKTTSYFAFQVLENVFDTLVQPDENLEMEPALAESWDLSEDQLTWTFTLREDVKFHDGSDFSADDVVYSYNRIVDEELANAWRLSAITSIEAKDDATVEIKVGQPTPNLLSSLGGFKGVAIVNEENASSGDITTKPVGTGPFALDSYTPSDSIELKTNPDYWGEAPKIAGVTFKFISEGSTAIAALKSGDVDWTDSIPAQQVAALEKDDALTLGQSASTDYWYLALNEKQEPWSDVRVRQAVSYAIDREAIAQATSYGTAAINQLAIPEDSTWYTEYSEYSLDPDKAKDLLAEAGVESPKMDLLVTSEYPETVTAAQIIADDLGKVGFDVSIRTPDFATWLDEQNTGNFDMLMMGWLGNIDPDDFYYAQHHSDGASNAQGYSNPEVDELLDAARTETDTDKRKGLYDELAPIIADEGSYIYLYNPSVIQAWTPALEGYTARSDRAIRFKDVSLTD